MWEVELEPHKTRTHLLSVQQHTLQDDGDDNTALTCHPDNPCACLFFLLSFSLFLHTLLILTTVDWSDRLPPNRRSDLLPHAAAKTRQKPDDDGGGGGTWELFLATINCNCAHQSESMF